MKTTDILYDLLREKIEGQIFYNNILVRMVNPLVIDLFKTFRDGEEMDLRNIRRQFLDMESRPMVFKSFINKKSK